MIRIFYLGVIVFLFLGCSAKNMGSTTDMSSTADLETFQFIITISSNNAILLREASVKYNQKADMIRQTENQTYYDNALYHKCRQWALLLNQKADMIEAGHLK